MPIEIRNSRGIFVVPDQNDVRFCVKLSKIPGEFKGDAPLLTLRDLLLAGF